LSKYRFKSFIYLFIIILIYAFLRSFNTPFFSRFLVHINTSTIGNNILSQLSNIILILFVIPIGYIIDRYKRNYFIALGAFIYGLVYILNPFTKNIYVILSLFIIAIIGLNIILIGLLSLIYDYSSKDNKGKSYALFLILTSIIGSIAYLSMKYIVDNIVSLRLMCFLMGGLGIITSIIALYVFEPDRYDEHQLSDANSIYIKDKNIFRTVTQPHILFLLISFIILGFGNTNYFLITFLERYKGISFLDLPMFSSTILMLLSFVICGFLIDILSKRNNYSNYYIIIIGVILFYITDAIIIISYNKTWLNIGYIGTLFTASFLTLPNILLFMTLIKSKYRMTVYGICIFLSQSIGVSLSRVTMAYLSDKYNIRLAMIVISIFVIISAITFTLSAICLSKYKKNTINDGKCWSKPEAKNC